MMSQQVKHGFKKTKSRRKSFLTGFTIVGCREIFENTFPDVEQKTYCKNRIDAPLQRTFHVDDDSIEHCLSPVIHVPRLSRDGLGNYVLSPRRQVSGIFRHDHDPEWVCLPILKRIIYHQWGGAGMQSSQGKGGVRRYHMLYVRPDV